MNAFIIYKGKYGATHQYAKWLGATVHYPVFRTDKVDGRNLSTHECIVLGGSVYEGKWQSAKWLRENLSYIKDKKIFIFIVCGTPAENKDGQDEIARRNIPAEIRNRCNIYFLRGRMIRKNLSWKDRLIMRLGAAFTKDPKEKERMNDFDEVKRESILPLINEIQKIQNQNNYKTTPNATLV